jgi:hypothetical protein
VHETRITLYDRDMPVRLAVPAGMTPCAGVAITPNIRLVDGQAVLAGGWCVVHEPTGLRLTERVFAQLVDARAFALLLAASGLDFTSTAIGGDELARTTVRACLAETVGARP